MIEVFLADFLTFGGV